MMQNKKNMNGKKLGGGYVKTGKSKTELLSPEEIAEKLENYEEADIKNIPLGVHVRYFKMEDGNRKFCSGGILCHNTGLPTYVMLSNGEYKWSVQVKDTIFLRKMTQNEINTQYKKEIDELQEKINILTERNKELDEENKKLIAYVKKIKRNSNMLTK